MSVFSAWQVSAWREKGAQGGVLDMPKVNFVKIDSLDELTLGLEKPVIIHLLVYVG